MEAKVSALPLFPLSVVLFPGQTLPLHIFEQRYRIMIQQCIENKEPFGVVLSYEHDQPVDIGTSARVTQVKKLQDGRMNIETVGEERFKILNLRQSDHGYLIGDVRFMPLVGEPRVSLLAQVSKRVRRYIKLLSEFGGVKFRFEAIPTDPTELALFSAIALGDLPLEVKQNLLSQDSLVDLLNEEANVLAEENRQMSIAMTAIRPPDDEHGFCRN
jgi:Lon protease-like protein